MEESGEKRREITGRARENGVKTGQHTVEESGEKRREITGRVRENGVKNGLFHRFSIFQSETNHPPAG